MLSHDGFDIKHVLPISKPSAIRKWSVSLPSGYPCADPHQQSYRENSRLIRGGELETQLLWVV